MKAPNKAGKYLCQVYDYINPAARDKYGWGTHWQIIHFNPTGFLGATDDWPVLYWIHLPPLPEINR